MASSEVCVVGGQVAVAPTSDHIMGMCFIGSSMVLLLLTIGIILGWKAHSLWSAWWPCSPCVPSRDVATQSQVRYGWGREEPRFVVVPEKEQGAWIDYWLDYEPTW